MKKKLLFTFWISFMLFFICLVFLYSSNISSIVIYSINIFIKNIFPSLFPMFIISYVLVNIGIPHFIGNLFSKLFTKAFKVKKEASFIFLMSLITGFPSSSKNACEMMEKKIFNEKDTEKVLMFTFFANPLFIINTVGNIFLNSKIIGFIIFISHILGNIFVGIIFRNKKPIYTDCEKVTLKDTNGNLYKDFNKKNIVFLIFNAIKNAIDVLFSVFGIITFFLILTSLICNVFSLNDYFKTFLSSILEMTTGLKNLSLLNIDINTKAVLSSMIISFGGLSVHSQIMSILENKKVKYAPFFFSRIVHSLFSGFITFILLVL